MNNRVHTLGMAALALMATSPALAQTGAGIGTQTNTGVNVGTPVGGASIGSTMSTGTTLDNTGVVSNNNRIGTGMTTDTGVSASSMGSWTSENAFWRRQYPSEPYFSSERDYSLYEPAYRYGVDLFAQNNGRAFTDLDQERLRRGWEQARGDSNLRWTEAELATRDAYNRLWEKQRRSGVVTNTGTTTRF